MKKNQKDKIRLWILTELYGIDELRRKLDEFANAHDIDSLETMEFFEQEVERINKLFCYPTEQQQ